MKKSVINCSDSENELNCAQREILLLTAWADVSRLINDSLEFKAATNVAAKSIALLLINILVEFGWIYRKSKKDLSYATDLWKWTETSTHPILLIFAELGLLSVAFWTFKLRSLQFFFLCVIHFENWMEQLKIEALYSMFSKTVKR